MLAPSVAFRPLATPGIFWRSLGASAVVALTSRLFAASETTAVTLDVAAVPVASLAVDMKGVSAFVAQLAAENSGPVLVPIAPGEFTMGDSSRVSGPPHRVTITRAFFLGATELTQAQWTAVMGTNPSRFRGDSLPVENVSWDDAMAFCRKLSDLERTAGRLPAGWEFRLPTEAQWEFACRAGTRGELAGKLDAMGWHRNNSGGQTHEVGTKQPNAWGLFDMHGNVWERCLDLYSSYPLDGSSVTDPTGPPPSTANPSTPGVLPSNGRIVRGGSWSHTATTCHWAYRAAVPQRNADGFGRPGKDPGCFGFRLALVQSR